MGRKATAKRPLVMPRSEMGRRGPRACIRKRVWARRRIALEITRGIGEFLKRGCSRSQPKGNVRQPEIMCVMLRNVLGHVVI